MAASTRLHLRFAAATLAVIATAGGALLWYVQHQESYAPVAPAVRSSAMPLTLLLLGTLIGLWAALSPLIQRVVRALGRGRTTRRSIELALEETPEQVRQAQKMEAIGRLAGGVAHDFNNLLLVINGYSELLATSLTDERQQRFAEQIRFAGGRAATLTQQLLAFSRRQVLQPRVLDLNDSIVEIDATLRGLTGEGIHVEFELERDLQPVQADPSQVGRVLLDLAVNARDAMAGAGTLTIATRNEGGDVVLEVSDTGIGMDGATQDRIFEPFFTTKDVGQGAGLGLATVYGVVTQSGGTIAVRSAPGRGATFVVRLPAVKRADEDDLPHAVERVAGNERILVVDDEKIVRDLLAQLLREEGYEVGIAGSGREARALAGPWDLLLTDVVMPETDGVKLSRQIDARHVLFISGYDQKALVEANASFLQKPFNRDELSRTVRDLFDGDGARDVLARASA